jgi:hypothetical protein
VSLKLKIGPVTNQISMMRAANMNVFGRPLTADVHRASREKIDGVCSASVM